MPLVNVSFQFQTLISEIIQYLFLKKHVSSFGSAKAFLVFFFFLLLFFFQQKISVYLIIKS